MIRVVSWNIAKRSEPWRELAEMGRRGEADVALLQEAGGPPGDLVHLIPYEDDGFWNRDLYDRWCRVVPLSDRVRVEPFRAVPPISELGPGDIGVSGIGTVRPRPVEPSGPCLRSANSGRARERTSAPSSWCPCTHGG